MKDPKSLKNVAEMNKVGQICKNQEGVSLPVVLPMEAQ